QRRTLRGARERHPVRDQARRRRIELAGRDQRAGVDSQVAADHVRALAPVAIQREEHIVLERGARLRGRGTWTRPEPEDREQAEETRHLSSSSIVVAIVGLHGSDTWATEHGMLVAFMTSLPT